MQPEQDRERTTNTADAEPETGATEQEVEAEDEAAKLGDFA